MRSPRSGTLEITQVAQIAREQGRDEGARERTVVGGHPSRSLLDA